MDWSSQEAILGTLPNGTVNAASTYLLVPKLTKMDQIWISRIFKLLKLVAMKKVPSVRYQSTREIPDGSDLMIMFIQQEMGTGELDYP